ncbi:putative nuclease HARBI1 [Hydra vulgaris]|uniref:putative nuclease HARBI1 n=1 Tax=Hydra vulgaris TaxID=6087 RepID=UPI001F5F726D|nr:putative nuclease HARBI1 [Hydra vulgaris]
MPRLVRMHLVFAEVRRQEIVVLRGLRRERLSRDRTNPLDIYDDVDLYQKFLRTSCFYLENLLKTDLQPKSNQSFCVPPIYQVLCALRFYATGSFQIVIGDSTAALSQPTISRIIRRVSLKFPRITGLIDGTHVCIQKPREHEYVYVNRSSNHLINVQAVCGYNGEFIDIVAKWHESTHNARILRESKLGKKMIDDLKGLLLGDSGYPCFRWLLTPYLSPTTAAQR